MILARRRLPESGGYCLHEKSNSLGLVLCSQGIQSANTASCKIHFYFNFRDSLPIVPSVGLKTQT